MCYADLVGANSLAPFEGGQDDGFLRMNFQAFSFASEKSDTIDIVSPQPAWRHYDVIMRSLWPRDIMMKSLTTMFSDAQCRFAQWTWMVKNSTKSAPTTESVLLGTMVPAQNPTAPHKNESKNLPKSDDVTIKKWTFNDVIILNSREVKLCGLYR